MLAVVYDPQQLAKEEEYLQDLLGRQEDIAWNGNRCRQAESNVREYQEETKRCESLWGTKN